MHEKQQSSTTHSNTHTQIIIIIIVRNGINRERAREIKSDGKTEMVKTKDCMEMKMFLALNTFAHTLRGSGREGEIKLRIEQEARLKSLL